MLKINHTFGLKNRGGVIFRGKRMGFFILLFHFYYTTKNFPMNAFLKSPALIMANKQKKGPGQTGQTTSFSWKSEVKWAEPTCGLHESDHVPWTRPNSIQGECRAGTTVRDFNRPNIFWTVRIYSPLAHHSPSSFSFSKIRTVGWNLRRSVPCVVPVRQTKTSHSWDPKRALDYRLHIILQNK